MRPMCFVQANGLSVFVRLSIRLYVPLSACLPTCLSIRCPSIHLPAYLGLFTSLSACLSVCLSVCRCTHLSIYLSEEVILYFRPH